MGVKFGMEEGEVFSWWRGPLVPSSVPNFTPIGAAIRVYDPKTEIFTEI